MPNRVDFSAVTGAPADAPTTPAEGTAGGPYRAACRNCSAPLAGDYCARCGQRDLDLERPLRELVAEWLGAVVAFDSRLLRTLWPLVARPGFLTREFLIGRRVRYVDPVKLYLAISLVVFVVLRLSGVAVVRVSNDDEVVAPITIRTSSGRGADEAARQTAAVAGSDPMPGATAEGEPGRPRTMIGRGLVRLFEQYEKNPAAFNGVFLDRLAKSVFVLLPVVALLLRLLYRRTRYVHQLVFALHFQSFVFVVVLIRLGLEAVGGDTVGALLLAVSVPTWLFLGLRALYGEGRLRTAVKLAALLVGGLASLLATLIATVAVTVLIA